MFYMFIWLQLSILMKIFIQTFVTSICYSLKAILFDLHDCQIPFSNSITVIPSVIPPCKIKF